MDVSGTQPLRSDYIARKFLEYGLTEINQEDRAQNTGDLLGRWLSNKSIFSRDLAHAVHLKEAATDAHASGSFVSIGKGYCAEIFDNVGSGNILKRAKSLIPLLVPLFIAAFKRADELANAMEARGYRGGEGRTKLNPLRYKRRDFIAYGLILLFPLLVLGLRQWI